MKRHAVQAMTALLVLLVLGCNLPAGSPTPGSALPLSTASSVPPSTPGVAESPASIPSTAQAPISAASDLVWFAPNMGSSDFAELFTRPEQWTRARTRVDVLKFYTQNLLDDPCSICGDNILPRFVDVDAFRTLASMGIAIAVEVPAVKEWGCTSDATFGVTQIAIRNVETHGGQVALLAMDEPLFGGQLVANGQSCGYQMEQSAAQTAAYMQRIRQTYPEISVGDIEPYPEYSVSELERWLLALQDGGAAPAFFHLDVDLERVRVEGRDVKADLVALARFCRENDIPFGVIFTSSWRAAGADRTYFDSTLGWVGTVNQAIGKPQHVVFQSWQGPAKDGLHEVPVNLPEDDPGVYSHTRLLLEGLEIFGR